MDPGIPNSNVPAWVFTALVVPAVLAMAGTIVWLAKAFISHLETVNKTCAEERVGDRLAFFKLLDEYKDQITDLRHETREHNIASKEIWRRLEVLDATLASNTHSTSQLADKVAQLLKV